MSAGLLWQETRALVRSRRAKLAAGILLYALLATPFLLTRPPPEVTAAVSTWFRAEDPRFAMFLFIWMDLVLNKVAAITGVILAGSILLDDDARGLLPLLLAKPVTRAEYFLTRLGAAAIVFALLFAGAALGGLALFPARVPGFQPGVFLAASAVHLLGALFAVVLSGAMAVWVRRRLPAMLASMFVLFALVGSAFLGFYNPAWAGYAQVNPFSHAVSVLGHLDALRPADVLRPVAILIPIHAAVAALGALRVRNLEV